MSNRIHLEDVTALNASVLLALPIDQLELLLSEARQAVEAAKGTLDLLTGAIETRFAAKAADLRRAKGKDTGTVRVIQGDYEVVADLPKKVTWDQSAIGAALDALDCVEHDVDMSRLVKVEIKIDERAYEALAPEHQAILLPARTVKTGKATYSLKPLAEV
jgi:hypothetical protein